MGSRGPTPLAECTIEGCTSPVRVKSKGWCNKHYRRWVRTGDPLKVAWERGNPEANFWAKVRRGSTDECWPWTGAISVDGYGVFVAPGYRMAHRYAYTLLVGLIPDGAELDHLCHNKAGCVLAGRDCPHRRCVNTAHLEPVTPTENRQRVNPVARRRGPLKIGTIQAAKTHCPRGHEYTAGNTYVDTRGSRNCRICARERSRQLGQTEARRAYQREYAREYQRRRRASLRRTEQ